MPNLCKPAYVAKVAYSGEPHHKYEQLRNVSLAKYIEQIV